MDSKRQYHDESTQLWYINGFLDVTYYLITARINARKMSIRRGLLVKTVWYAKNPWAKRDEDAYFPS
jgi:hypothetical protein